MGQDRAGFPTVTWEAMRPAAARTIAAALAVFVVAWTWSYIKYPIEFRGLIRAMERAAPAWIDLVFAGLGTILCLAPAAVFVPLALRLAFRAQPERITLGPAALNYEPGSSFFSRRPDRSSRLGALWNVIRGRASLEIPSLDISAVSVDTSRRTRSLRIQTSDGLVRIGRSLTSEEQRWLAGVLLEWRRRH